RWSQRRPRLGVLRIFAHIRVCSSPSRRHRLIRGSATNSRSSSVVFQFGSYSLSDHTAKFHPVHIGLLDHLWIGPIPAAFNRSKTERAQEGREALFHCSERFI